MDLGLGRLLGTVPPVSSPPASLSVDGMRVAPSDRVAGDAEPPVLRVLSLRHAVVLGSLTRVLCGIGRTSCHLRCAAALLFCRENLFRCESDTIHACETVKRSILPVPPPQFPCEQLGECLHLPRPRQAVPFLTDGETDGVYGLVWIFSPVLWVKKKHAQASEQFTLSAGPQSGAAVTRWTPALGPDAEHGGIADCDSAACWR